MKLTMDNLPNQILVRIFEFLSAPERILIERVCTKWNNLSQISWFWYRFINDDFYVYKKRIDERKEKFKVFPILNERVRSDILSKVLSRTGKYIKSIDLGKNDVTWNLNTAVGFCSNLEEIRFFGTLSGSFLNSLTQHCHHLRLISFTSSFSNIVDLELGYLFQNCIQLRTVELKEIAITGRCLNYLPVEIKSVSFTECDWLENQEVQNLINRCSQLETLELVECSRIVGDSLLYTLPKLVELRTLRLSSVETLHGPQLCIAFSVLHHLTQLELSSSEWVDDEMLEIIGRFLLNLCKLNISDCINVSDDGITHLCQLQCLTSLSVSCCGHFVKSMAKCGRLQVLEIKDRVEISIEATVELAERCLNLTKLFLSECFTISDRCIEILAKLRHLEVLKLYWCTSVTDDAVKSLAEYRPPLTELHLYLSKITDVGVKMLFELDRLEVLFLSSNDNITDDSVKVLTKCKNLRKLDLSSCTKITTGSVFSFLDDIDKKSTPISLYVFGTKVCEEIERIAKVPEWYFGYIFVHPLLKIKIY